MTAPARAPMIRKDRFPVAVRELDAADPRAWREVRVLLTVAEPDLPARMLLYTRPSDVPALELGWRPEASILGRKTVPWRIETVTLDDAETRAAFVVEPIGHCGCGNRLKLWDPFSPMRMVVG